MVRARVRVKVRARARARVRVWGATRDQNVLEATVRAEAPLGVGVVRGEEQVGRDGQPAPANG